MGLWSCPKNTKEASFGTEYGAGSDGKEYGFHQETCKTAEALAKFNAKMVNNIKEQQYEILSSGSKGNEVWFYYRRPQLQKLNG